MEGNEMEETEGRKGRNRGGAAGRAENPFLTSAIVAAVAISAFGMGAPNRPDSTPRLCRILRTDGQTEGRTGGRTDRRTDGRKERTKERRKAGRKEGTPDGMWINKHQTEYIGTKYNGCILKKNVISQKFHNSYNERLCNGQTMTGPRPNGLKMD